MASKIQVLLLRAKNVDEVSDMNKMAVHLEQMLLEKDGVELKTRQSLTDPAIKSSDFIVFCGYDCGVLSELFKTLSVMEGIEDKNPPIVFIYEEPGNSIYEKIDRILMEGVDLSRINPKIFKNIIDTSTYRDIIGYIDVSIKKLGASSTSKPGE